jgi:hypothetical protein
MLRGRYKANMNVKVSMEYPTEIEQLRTLLKSMPGVVNVDASHTPLEDVDNAQLSLLPFGDLPHAAIQRTNGGLPTEALGQIFITLAPCSASWMTLEFISWQVRDWSRAGRGVQIRTRGLPPAIGTQLQLGSSLQVIIDFFVSGMDLEPGRLLGEIQEFAMDLTESLELYSLDWQDGTVKKRVNTVLQ